MVHTGEYTIRQVKEAMHAAGVPTRLCFDSLRAMAI